MIWIHFIIALSRFPSLFKKRETYPAVAGLLETCVLCSKKVARWPPYTRRNNENGNCVMFAGQKREKTNQMRIHSKVFAWTMQHAWVMYQVHKTRETQCMHKILSILCCRPRARIRRIHVKIFLTIAASPSFFALATTKLTNTEPSLQLQFSILTSCLELKFVDFDLQLL